MRHEKSAQLIELARELANTRMGLTLDEMADKMSVKRRTIERMRDRLLEMFDTMEEVPDPPTKRWRINGRLDGFLQVPTSKEIAALKSAQLHFENHSLDAAFALKGLETKMMAAIGPKLSKLEPDIEALMQAEAIAVSPGPRPSFNTFTLNVLRDAILMMRQVSFVYDGGSKSNILRELIPYGILFGGEAYLIGVEPSKYKGGRPQVWRVDKIREIELSDKIGAAPEDFSLREFSHRSFGVFQEDVVHQVKLRVFKDFAEEAKRWVFHPNQTMLEQSDGGLEIQMEGGGLRELAWGLFRWGGKLEILEPQELKDEMQSALKLANGIVT